MKRALVVACVGMVAVGCAAESKQRETAMPSSTPESPRPQAGYPSTTTPAQAQGAPSSSPDAAPTMPAQPGTFAPSPEMHAANEDFERGRRELAAAAGQCKDACRALSSMDRAAGKICGLEPGDRCVGAKDKLYSARDQVRVACGTCSDGTATDRNAPVPSR